ncbi:hypothetical protein NDA10_004779 [Ustilago hordei]|nr:hypothetical protein NDA10_004779 [Ustilago hordei]
MPSAQSTRPTNNGVKKNFVWQAQGIECLVDTIYINKSYQHTILPSCCNKANKPANKICKDTVYCDLCKPLFPTRAVDPSHIKFKVHWLQETYCQGSRARNPGYEPNLLKHYQMVQDHFNQVMEDEVYGMPNTPKDGQLLKYIIDDDEEQTISPLTILVECVSALYKGTHGLGPFANQIELGKQMQTRVNLFMRNEEWDASHILDLKIEGQPELAPKQTNLPMKMDTPTSVGGDPSYSDPDGPNRIFATLAVVPFTWNILDQKATTFEDADSMLSSIIMCSFSNKLHTEYFTEHGDQPMLIAVNLFDWAVDKCKKHSAAREYELLSAAYAFRWDQVGSNAYDFLIKWEALMSELHAYLHEPWTLDHRYRMLKRALPSDKNALFNSIFILHEQLHGREETMESVAHVLCQCYELAADSTSVSMHNTTEESELITLQAATLINCWACGDIGHTANRCPNDTAHA